jgi:hypothetical protein
LAPDFVITAWTRNLVAAAQKTKLNRIED